MQTGPDRALAVCLACAARVVLADLLQLLGLVALVVVAAADKMLARVLVSEDNLNQVRKGKSAKVTVGGKQYSGKILTVGLEQTTGKGGVTGYPVDVEFATKEATLRSGQTAKVSIE